jgi:AcrR family transcriptional regulator
MMHTDGTDVKKRSRKAVQGEETRAALLAVARKQFGASGFGDTSIEELAAAAGVTKGAFYYHFTNKEAVFRAVYEQVKRDITDHVAPSFLIADPWEALLAGCQATLDAHLDPAVRRIVLFDSRAVLGWEVVHEIENRYGAIVLRGALRRCVNAKMIESQPLVQLAQMLNGALAEACLLIADADDQQAARKEVGAIVERILQGLRPRA